MICEFIIFICYKNDLRVVKFFGKFLRNFVLYMIYEFRVECFFKGGEGVEDI